MTKNARYRELTKDAKTTRIAAGAYRYKSWDITRIWFDDTDTYAWVACNRETNEDLGDTCESKAEALYYTMVALGKIK